MHCKRMRRAVSTQSRPKGAMEEAASSKAFTDDNTKSRKSVAFGKLSTSLKADRDQRVSSPQALSQTSSVSVNAKGGIKIEDLLNYYHLVELNELFKVLYVDTIVSFVYISYK